MSQSGTVPKSHNSGLFHAKIRPTVESLEALVRRRVRTLYERVGKSGEKWTAEKLAPFLGMTDPSGVRKLLNGDNKISLAHLQGFAEAFAVTPCELVSPDGAQFTYLKEFEPAILRLVREMNEHERHSLMAILQWRAPRYVEVKKSRLGRAMLTVKEQELVDLYARVKKDGVREGVLKTLRGAAQDDDRPAQVKPRTTG